MLDIPNQKTLPYWTIALLCGAIGFQYADKEKKDQYWRDLLEKQAVECQAKSDSLYGKILDAKKDLANFREEQARVYKEYFETIAKLKKR